MTQVSFYPRSEFPHGPIEVWLSDPQQRPAHHGEVHGEVSGVKHRGYVYHLGRLKAEMQSSWPSDVQAAINARGVGMPDSLYVVWE
jgi:hypothetical protein